MSRKIFFRETFPVSGIMCGGCGDTVYTNLTNCLEECKKIYDLPEDARLIINPNPQKRGIHCLTLIIDSEKEDLVIPEDNYKALCEKFKSQLNVDDYEQFKVVDLGEEVQQEKPDYSNWINLAVNLLATILIIALSFAFPPSILLTVGLAAISFAATAFSARQYLFNFIQNIRNKDYANMTTTITLGWLLSVAHTLFHAITMPLASSFSMIFMSYLMPITLMSSINGMDEIKRQVFNKSKKMSLSGIKNLFPQMSKAYPCYPLEVKDLATMKFWLAKKANAELDITEEQTIQQLLKTAVFAKTQSELLQEGMVLKVKRGQCFPVDCILLNDMTLIDASLLTGEPRQTKHSKEEIPAGAINLGQTVLVYALKNTYKSTVTQMLFRANRDFEEEPIPEATTETSTVIITKPTSNFTYLYAALIIIAIVAAVAVPLGLGILTLPMFFANVMGIVFSVCLCTAVIAHDLPPTLYNYHLNKKGIQLRDENLNERMDEIHTFIFDKTGTLTTGNSKVESTDIHSKTLWKRIYLLEKELGADHPLAMAIIKYYDGKFSKPSSNVNFTEVENSEPDPQNRGLSAMVEGEQTYIGNAAYFEDLGIKIPEINNEKLAKGLTPVYVAVKKTNQEAKHQGVIYIEHEIRPGIKEALSHLQKKGKRLILLTGDNAIAAQGFNQQIGNLFKDGIYDGQTPEKNIYAEQTPEKKEAFLGKLMNSSKKDPKGFCFVCDGLNDGAAASIVSEKGGLSCAMKNNDKASYFTDISLNGSLDYLFKRNKLNLFLPKIIKQNQGILASSTVASLLFIICFSVAGIAVSPLIPLGLMVSTFLFVLFNSYRMQLAVDTALDTNTSWPKKLLASDLSLVLLLGASFMLICGILITTIATGGFALPAIVFTAGAVTALSSTCTLAAIVMFSSFVLLALSSVVVDKYEAPAETENENLSKELPQDLQPQTSVYRESEGFSFARLFSEVPQKRVIEDRAGQKLSF